MKFNRYLLALSTLLYCGNYSFGQTFISGSVIDSKTYEFLPGAHVYTSSKRLAISDDTGLFKIAFDVADTLFISVIGYETLSIPSHTLSGKESIIFSMKQKDYQLDEFVIEEEEEFETILKVEKRDSLFMSGISKKYSKEQWYDNYFNESAVNGLGINLYKLTKKYKERKKHYFLTKRIRNQNRLKLEAYKKLDLLLELERIFIDRSEYEKLIGHCNLTVEKIRKTSLHDLLIQIKDINCFETYYK